MQHTVTVTRNMRGELQAENEIPMSHPGRVLIIRTSKGSRGLQTTASSCIVKHEDNGFVSHSYELFGDFRKTVAQSTARATAKAIEAQHAAALRVLDATMEEAEAFYVAKAAKAGAAPRGWDKIEGDDAPTAAARAFGAGLSPTVED